MGRGGLRAEDEVFLLATERTKHLDCFKAL